jgi:trans-aconitate 2-methyltransferase
VSTAPGTREWDAATYDRISDPMVALGLEVLERLPLRGDEIVLDAGCGSGRVTRHLVERLPRGRVVAVDGSAAMVELARAELGPAVEVRRADLVELELAEPVDAVLSTAVFHWIPDHPRLFGRLAAALRPGGRLEAQCGGAGNLDRFHGALQRVLEDPAWAPAFRDWAGPWNFAGADETRERLERAGFREVRCWLEPRTIHPPEPLHYLRSICLGHHLERLPEERREAFVRAVLDRAGDPPVLDHVRLNISAVRG